MKKFLAAVFVAAALGAVARELPEASAAKLPRWRGFNLLEMFNAGHAGPFHEEDFQMIAELGFDFVRLPMDYRIWIKNGDWRQIDAAKLAAVDQAVEFGKKHGVHVCLNFHRAPGYTVARPKEAKDLWSDAEALEVCSMHWAHFARRFKGVPNKNLSFDLLNEPSDIEPEKHDRVIRALTEAIHKEDPDRLVLADGRSWGTKPSMGLADAGIGQMTRGYAPFQLTHYKASWANGGNFPLPTWPIMRAVTPLFGPGKKPWNVPVVIEGPFPAGTLRLRVHEVSSHAKFIVSADGEKIWSRDFVPGTKDTDCKKMRSDGKWSYGVYDRDYTVPLREGAKKIELSIAEGDWLDLAELGISADGKPERTLAFSHDFGKTNGVIRFASDASPAFTTTDIYDAARLWREMIEPWQALEKKGVGVMVGEWGAYNKTPHDVTLRWMEDCLKNWQAANWGWAVWNFRGSFGPLDSGRDDVKYEDFHGHKLDREMMTLLQKY